MTIEIVKIVYSTFRSWGFYVANDFSKSLNKLTTNIISNLYKIFRTSCFISCTGTEPGSSVCSQNISQPWYLCLAWSYIIIIWHFKLFVFANDFIYIFFFSVTDNKFLDSTFVDKTTGEESSSGTLFAVSLYSSMQCSTFLYTLCNNEPAAVSNSLLKMFRALRSPHPDYCRRSCGSPGSLYRSSSRWVLTAVWTRRSEMWNNSCLFRQLINELLW